MRTIKTLTAIAVLVALTGCAGLVVDPPPTVIVTASPADGRAPLLVQFTATGSGEDARPVEYAWDFGDGTQHASASAATVEHEYTRSGTFDARLVVTVDGGTTSADSVTVRVENRPPFASCRLSSDTPVVGERILFDGSGSFDADGEIVDFAWDFGDGEAMRGTRVSHAYDEIGVYTITLVVADDAGGTAALTHTVTVHLGGSGGCGGGSPICL